MKKNKLFSIAISFVLLISLPVAASSEDNVEAPDNYAESVFNASGIVDDAVILGESPVFYDVSALDDTPVPENPVSLEEPVIPGEIVVFDDVLPIAEVIYCEYEQEEAFCMENDEMTELSAEREAEPFIISAEFEVIPFDEHAEINGYWLFSGDIEYEAVLVGYELFLNGELIAKYEEDATGIVNDGSLEYQFDTSDILDFPLSQIADYEFDPYIKFVPDYDSYERGYSADAIIYRCSEVPAVGEATAEMTPGNISSFITNGAIHSKQAETLIGDINGDGETTSGDVAMLKALILGKRKITEDIKKTADLNGDGQITSSDLVKLKTATLEQ